MSEIWNLNKKSNLTPPVIHRTNTNEDWIQEIISSDAKNKFTLIVNKAMKVNFDDDDNFPNGLTKKALGLNLGYSETRIKNIIYGEDGRTSNRDLIIAICVFLKLSSKATNQCLKCYNLSIFNKEDERDIIIMSAIDNNMDIDSLHKELLDNKLDGLDINLFKEKTIKPKPTSSKCITLLEDIYCFDAATFFGFKGLSMLYNPDYLYAEASALVKNQDSPQVYKLITDSTKFYIYDDPSSMQPSKYFATLKNCPVPEFSSKFFELRKKLNKRIEDTKNILNDTRNYKIRFDCRIENGLMKIYSEVFEPTRNIYYQMLKLGSCCEMTVTNYSLFLRYHIGDSVYKECKYTILDQPPLLKFTNICDIEEQSLKQRNLKGPVYKINLKDMKDMYEYLQSQIDCLLGDIIDKKICVYDLNALDDYYLDPAQVFNIKSDFEWSFCEECPSCSIPNTYEYKLSLLDGRTRLINFDILRRAIEIGIDDIDNLRIILTEYDTLDAFLTAQRNLLDSHTA